MGQGLYLVALTGLIWACWRILSVTLLKLKLERIDPIINTLFVPWAIFVGLIFEISGSQPVRLSLAIIVSVIFGGFTVWAVLSRRKSKKHAKTGKAALERTEASMLLLSDISVIPSVIMIGLAAYLFYQAGGLAADYSSLMRLVQEYNASGITLTGVNVSADPLLILRSILVGSVSMGLAVFNISLTCFFNGLVRGRGRRVVKARRRRANS
jgi:hypothetical protein